MIRFKYRFCKVHMARFVNGDLAEPVRRRVARYIDECEDCYREYMQHREFAHKLERSLPTFGKPGAATLDKVWISLQADMQAPPTRSDGIHAPAGLKFSYGLVIAAITLALLLPMLIGIHAAGLSVDLPLGPGYASTLSDSGASSAGMASIGATAEPNPRRRTPRLQNTPSPR